MPDEIGENRMVMDQDDAYERQWMTEGEEADALEAAQERLCDIYQFAPDVDTATRYKLNGVEWLACAERVGHAEAFLDCLHDAMTDHSRHDLDHPLEGLVAQYLLGILGNDLERIRDAEQAVGALLLPLVCDYLARIDL